MGSQQLLLIVVGVVIIGIMIAFGMFMFRDQAAATNRDSMSTDMVQLAAVAQKYYRRPEMFGGGGSSFKGLTINSLTSKPVNANGTYTLSPAGPLPPGTQSVSIEGTGKELGVDGVNMVKLTMTVMADSVLLVTNN
jgi:Tfp pilus assembly protein PilE